MQLWKNLFAVEVMTLQWTNGVPGASMMVWEHLLLVVAFAWLGGGGRGVQWEGQVTYHVCSLPLRHMVPLWVGVIVRPRNS